jgi:hypothetical protein
MNTTWPSMPFQPENVFPDVSGAANQAVVFEIEAVRELSKYDR